MNLIELLIFLKDKGVTTNTAMNACRQAMLKEKREPSDFMSLAPQKGDVWIIEFAYDPTHIQIVEATNDTVYWKEKCFFGGIVKIEPITEFDKRTKILLCSPHPTHPLLPAQPTPKSKAAWPRPTGTTSTLSSQNAEPPTF